ncbi:MAG: zinc-binding dehydrogenase [Actinobacteria bacterium]|nr:zinc-binding dehydrogenase [Actinomycetota bacterium]
MTPTPAILVRRFGGPEVLQPIEVPIAPPGPGEVAIAVEAASVTFVETQMRAGEAPRPEMLPTLPWVPGNGVAGTVAELGAGVEAALLGTRVVSTTGGAGGYAARALVGAEVPVAIPASLPMDVAAALVADGRTALGLAAAAALAAGERVLVAPAAGGVGSLLVQLANHISAEVVAAAGGERKLATCRELGAAEIHDYLRAGWSEEVEPVDVVLDGVGGEIGSAAFSRLRSGGRYLPFGAAGGPFAPVDRESASKRSIAIVSSPPPSPPEHRRRIEDALAAASAGTLAPRIGARLPLAEAAAAHRAIEARATIGKTLLIP